MSSDLSQLVGRNYEIILADPPWSYRDKGNAGKRGSSHHYDCMTLDDICAMAAEVADISAPNCLLAMWWVPPMPREALRVIDAWGFRLRTMKGFTWHKRTKNGHSHFGLGHWTRSNSEDCLFATRGKPKRVSAAVSQIIEAQTGRHSEKPEEAKARLVRLMGDVPRIELFARARTHGWDAWGNEA